MLYRLAMPLPWPLKALELQMWVLTPLPVACFGKYFFPYWIALAFLSKIIFLYMFGSISGYCILLQQYTYLCSCQYNIVVITTVLLYFLKSGSIFFLCFLLCNIHFTILHHFHFHVDFKINLSLCIKELSRHFVEIAWNL